MAGRKAHEPTEKDRHQAETLSGLGIPQEMIATILQISQDTLARHYREELDRGLAKAATQIAGWAFDSARKGNVTMRIFLAKTRLGWRETTHHELTGKDGKDIVPIINITAK